MCLRLSVIKDDVWYHARDKQDFLYRLYELTVYFQLFILYVKLFHREVLSIYKTGWALDFHPSFYKNRFSAIR